MAKFEQNIKGKNIKAGKVSAKIGDVDASDSDLLNQNIEAQETVEIQEATIEVGNVKFTPKIVAIITAIGIIVLGVVGHIMNWVGTNPKTQTPINIEIKPELEKDTNEEVLDSIEVKQSIK